MSRSGTTFFDRHREKPAQPVVSAADSKLTSVDVGGQGDCGYRAAAAAMMDAVFSIQSEANQELAEKLLALHAKYFEQPAILKRPMPAIKRLEEFWGGEDDESRAQFLSDLAYALRGETVKELKSNLGRYQGAFVANNEKTSPEAMRQQSTPIDETAIAALAEVMQIPIKVKKVRENKEELPMPPLHYNFEASPSAKIVLQLQGEHYLANLRNPKPFAGIKGQAVEPAQPRTKIPPEQDPELEKILAQIDEENTILLSKYEDAKKRLTYMVKDEGLTEKGLLALYAAGMPTSDYLRGHVKYIGTEYGCQSFFEDIAAASKAAQSSEPVSSRRESQNAFLAEKLIHALALAMSIGQLNEKFIDDIADKKLGQMQPGPA